MPLGLLLPVASRIIPICGASIPGFFQKSVITWTKKILLRIAEQISGWTRLASRDDGHLAERDEYIAASFATRNQNAFRTFRFRRSRDPGAVDHLSNDPLFFRVLDLDAY